MTTRPHRSIVYAGMLACVLALAGCESATDDPTPTAQPTPSEEASVAASAAASASEHAGDGEETSVFELTAGDCFSAERTELDTVTVVDCDASHEYEVFEVFDHTAGADEAFPGEQELLEYADTECQPFFEEFVGHDYQTSIWYITSLMPSTDTWADGDREIVCALNQQDDDLEPISVTGSAEGSAE